MKAIAHPATGREARCPNDVGDADRRVVNLARADAALPLGDARVAWMRSRAPEGAWERASWTTNRRTIGSIRGCR